MLTLLIHLIYLAIYIILALMEFLFILPLLADLFIHIISQTELCMAVSLLSLAFVPFPYGVAIATVLAGGNTPVAMVRFARAHRYSFYIAVLLLLLGYPVVCLLRGAASEGLAEGGVVRGS